MSEMVERVARALWSPKRPEAWDDAREELRELIRANARAAIEAMREPTDDMVDYAESESYPDDPSPARMLYRDMIDEALRG